MFTFSRPRLLGSRPAGARPRGLLLFSAGCALIGLSATSLVGSALATEVLVPQAQKPNIVMFLVDDLDQITSPYWQALPQTKALIADQGMNFKNSFAPTPICCPARATILTGELGHNSGVLTNAGNLGGWAAYVKNGGQEKAFVNKLSQDAGYRTALFGKYLNGYGISKNPVDPPAPGEPDPTNLATPPGWSEWYAAFDTGIYQGYKYTMNENGVLKNYGDTPADYQTDVIRNQAVDFIDRAETRNDSQPFFMYVAPTAPHTSIPPAPRHANSRWATATPKYPLSFQEEDLSDKSPWLKNSGEARKAEVAKIYETEWRRRMGALLAVDDMVAAVVKKLKDSGELDNTYLLFASDNGFNLGAHRLNGKSVPYEESIRVPLVISGPGIAKGSSTDAFTLQTDYAPTILRWAGFANPSYSDGRSLRPVLNQETPNWWRKDFIAQYSNKVDSLGPEAEVSGSEPPDVLAAFNRDVPSYKALRTATHLYVEWSDWTTPGITDYELYDLGSDPGQLTNLLATAAGRNANQQLVATMKTRLTYLSTCAGVTCRR